MEHLHDDGRAYESGKEEHLCVSLHPCAYVLSDVVRLGDALEEDKVSEGCESDAAEDGDGVTRMALVIECEDNTREPLYDNTEHEGYGNTHEDGYDDAQCLVRIEEVAEGKIRVGCHLQDGEDERTSEKLEHQ